MVESQGERNRKRRRKTSELARDRKRISELYLRGWLQHDIATEVGVSQSTVSLDLKHLHSKWRESALFNHDAYIRNELSEIEQELNRVDLLEGLAYQQWLTSLEAESSQTLYMEPGEDGQPSLDRAVQHEGQEGRGDIRWWDAMCKCIAMRESLRDRRARILSAYVERREITGEGGGGINVIFQSNVNLAELEAKALAERELAEAENG